MTRIIIEAVPPDKMRLNAYKEDGCGDWFTDPATGDVHIVVAGADVWTNDASFLLALHELFEARLCSRDGVTQESVDMFDAAFTGDGEPGDDPGAPYRTQHRAAMLIEHAAALLMGKYNHGEMR